MPIKDKEEKQKYNREWYRRKKLGLPTRGILIRQTVKMSEEERKRRKKERDKKYRMITAKKRKDLIEKHLGTTCTFCNTINGRLIVHRKDDTKHKYFHLLPIDDLRKALESNEYALVCYRCHKGVHWVMKFLELD